MLELMAKMPWMIFRYARQMAGLHAQIHSIETDSIPEQKQSLEFFIKRIENISNEEKEIILSYLNSLEIKKFLCHGDFHPDNVLISGGKPYIIDWMTAVSGNPEADLARSIVMLKYGKLPPQVPFLTRTLLYTFKSLYCNLYVKYYRELTGISMDAVEKWFLPVAAARLNEYLFDKEKKALVKLIKRDIKKIRKQLQAAL